MRVCVYGVCVNVFAGMFVCMCNIVNVYVCACVVCARTHTCSFVCMCVFVRVYSHVCLLFCMRICPCERVSMTYMKPTKYVFTRSSPANISASGALFMDVVVRLF